MEQLRWILLLLPFIYSYSIAPIDLTGKESTPDTLVIDLSSSTESGLAFSPYNLDPFAEKNTKFNDASSLKELALHSASLGETEKSVDYIEKYLFQEFNTSIFANEVFLNIQDSEAFRDLKEKYEPSFSIWSFIYLYVALIGFYISVIINFNKKIDLPARILISGFLFIHSFFILHICLNITNFQYKFPHSYAMSTCFSFLYGPLLYFYFKRITQQYQFRSIDLLHLIPTAVFLIYMFPTYGLSGEEKLALMLERNTFGRGMSDIATIILKLTSLAVYGYFISRLYKSSRRVKNLLKENKVWQKNIFGIHIIYIFCYAAYGILLSNNITSGFFYHMQVSSMALMVMYIGYSANVQPNVFSGSYAFGKGLFFKYKKSGLTESLSNELRENLVHLFNQEKIYKESDINLDTVAQHLNTTRHNASQVINEHFQMNFHELVNKYRINEAKAILQMDGQNNLNIIDVAYEVGYNNKVTFNKAFKKDTQLTPSEFQKISIKVKA